MLASVLGLVANGGRVSFQLMLALGDANVQTYSMAMMGCNIVAWVGYSLMIVAVFAGRNPPMPYRVRRDLLDADDDWGRPAAAPAKDATGFQERKP